MKDQSLAYDMDISLLDVLASPPRKMPATPCGTCFDKENLSACESGTTSKQSSLGEPKQRGPNQCHPATNNSAPSFSETSPQIVPGRMENLRILIEEGKNAVSEGRIAAALRKYETAMVTLPETYKPRLRRKIERLEKHLSEEKSLSSTPLRVSRARQDIIVASEGGVMGPVELLQIAVQEMAAANNALGSKDSAENSLVLSSPLDRKAQASTRFISSMPDVELAGLVLEQQGSSKRQDEDCTVYSGAYDGCEQMGVNISPNKERLDGSAQRGSLDKEPSRSGELFGIDGGRDGCENHGGQTGGLNEVEDEKDTEVSTKQKQELLRVVNKDLSEKLEKQVVDIVNHANVQELTQLYGIGARRAQLIVQKRAEMAFETLGDLTRIGMYPKQIEKMGKHNMLERLGLPSEKGCCSTSENSHSA